METKRGAPPRDGKLYDCSVVGICGEQYDTILQHDYHGTFRAKTGAIIPDRQILAHRPHVPVEVPALKKVEKKVVTPCVLEDGKPGFVTDGRLYSLGDRHIAPVCFKGDSTRPFTCPPHYTDRDSCEAAGYEWPF